MQEQEDVLQQCVRQLEGAEASHLTLVSLLKEAVQDQVCSCLIACYPLFISPQQVVILPLQLCTISVFLI